MRYFGQKLVNLLIVLFAVTFTVSLALSALPNSEERILAAKSVNPQNVEAANAVLDELHLRDSQIEQYGYFMKDLVTGDWGVTFQGNQSIKTSIWDGLQISLRLMIYAQIIALLLAMPIAIVSAYRNGGFFDRAATTSSFGALSLPPYILAPLFILLFSVRWGWFTSRSENTPLFDDPLQHFKDYFMPTLVLAIPLAATYMRLLRADLIATLQGDFITTARAKGLSTSRILLGHALRPSTFSLVTAAALNTGTLVGGSLVVETAFGLNGLGYKTVVGIFGNEFRLVQITVLILAMVYVFVNFFVDIAYGWIDPRIRAARALT